MLHISRECEKILRELVASGAFASFDEALSHAVFLLSQEQDEASEKGQSHAENDTGSDRHRSPKSGDEAAIDPPLRAMKKHVDVEKLAVEQGVEPIRDFRKLKFDSWPENESVDDFLAFLRASRKERLAELGLLPLWSKLSQSCTKERSCLMLQGNEI